VAWPQGKQDGGDEIRFHESVVIAENAARAKAAHDTRVFLFA
jgi:hypothetical protein